MSDSSPADPSSSQRALALLSRVMDREIRLGQPADTASLPLALARHVDQVCYRFEAAWKADGAPGTPPRIEEYLADTPEPARADLLRELILVDIYYRCLLGQAVRAGEYLARFPELERSPP
jgi:hypothetical protein